MLTKLFLNVLEVNASMSVLIGILLLLGVPIRRFCRPEWRYIAFLLLAGRLLFPFNTKYEEVPAAVTLSAVFGGNREVAAAVAGACALVWLAGVLFFAGRCLFQHLRFQSNLRRWGHAPARKRTGELLLEARLATDILDSRPGLLICGKIDSPVTVGFFRPLILLPSEDYSETELDAIYRHELVHCRRHDVWYKLLILSACALNWFNPVVWAMLSAATSDMELSCDTEVVRRSKGGYRRQYSEAILFSMSRKMGTKRGRKPEPQEALAAAFNGKKRMKSRISNIFDRHKKLEGILGLLSFGALVMLFSIIVSVTI